MIRVLPPEVINQIAAGEVVERPFSVIKELVENSLDAGATRLHVELQDGGRELMRITDNGCGFSAADLKLAFVSHATSKLGCIGDLDHIASLGFRGEALASIGSVSHATIRSRQTGSEEGFEISADGGKISTVKPCGCPEGTILEIRDLFFNVPARRRFLKTPRAERAKIQDLLTRLALARLDVDFTLEADGKQVLRLPAGESLQERVTRTFGKTIGSNLYEVHREWDGYKVTGLVCDPDIARRDSTLELLYINGRCAKDKAVTQAVRQAYREYLMGGRFPIYFLMLSVPPDEVDVNVHPAKAEVRFVETRRVSGLLHEAAKSGLSNRVIDDATAAAIEVGEDKPRAQSGFPDLPSDLFGSSGTASMPSHRTNSNSPVSYSPGTDSGASPVGGAGVSGGQSSPSPSRGASSRGSRAPLMPELEAEFAQPVQQQLSGMSDPDDRFGQGVIEGDAEAKPHPFRGAADKQFLQIMDLYVLFEGEDGLVVVDQHALHERVLYEKFKARHDGRAVQVQQMLIPEVVEVTASDKVWLLEAKDVLQEHGFLIEDAGDEGVAIHGVPALLSRAVPKRLLETFLQGDEGDVRPLAHEAIVERFHSMACRAAVMSGDRLSQEEMRVLLEDASSLEHPHNCPHGRPTVLTFHGAELERYFRRKL